MRTAQNQPFQILVPASVLKTKDKLWDELTNNQLGFMNAKTHKSTVLADVDDNPNIYLAVGGSTIEDIKKSREICSNAVRNYQVGCYKAPKSKIIALKNACVDCDETYVINFTFSNIKQMTWMGLATNSKTVSIVTPCCDECKDCPSGNCVDALKAFRDTINADTDGLIKADLYAKGAALGDDPLTDEEIATLSTDYAADPDATGCPEIRFTADPEKLKACCNEPVFGLNYMDFTVEWVSDNCCGTVETIQDLKIEENTGFQGYSRYPLAAMYNGKDAYLYDIANGGIPNCIENPFDTTKNYTVIVIEAETASEGGREAWNNPYLIEIWVECSLTTQAGDIVAYFDAWAAASGIAPLASVVAGCDCTGA